MEKLKKKLKNFLKRITKKRTMKTTEVQERNNKKFSMINMWMIQSHQNDDCTQTELTDD